MRKAHDRIRRGDYQSPAGGHNDRPYIHKM